jgi:hypothetical protein
MHSGNYVREKGKDLAKSHCAQERDLGRRAAARFAEFG